MDNRVRVKLESKKDMKKRGVDSPDDADALALTFAQTVAPIQKPTGPPPRPASVWG
jgi:phage terminase large subunit